MPFLDGRMSSLLFDSIVPLVGDLLLPVLVLLNLLDSVANNLEGLLHLEVLHIFVIVEVVGELEQLIDFFFLLLLELLLSLGPRRFLALLRLALGLIGQSPKADRFLVVEVNRFARRPHRISCH